MFILWATDVADSWLSHRAASRKVAGLIPGGVIGISIDLILLAST